VDPSHKKYILENLARKSPAEIARDLGLKERAVKRFLERERPSGRKPAASAPSGPASAPDIGRTIGFLALLLASGFLVYSNTLSSSFHYDDQFMILENPAIRGLRLPEIWDAFNTRFLAGLSFALNYAAGGLEPAVYHWTSVVLHALAAFAVFLLVRLTLTTPRVLERPLPAAAPPIAGFAALLFLAHPVQTQAVDYVWQRAAVLAALFYALSLYFYARWRLSGRRPDLVFSFSAALAAMFTKETAFTIPFAIALYEFLFFGPELLARRLRRLAPFLLLLAVIPLTLTRVDKISTNLMRPETAARGTQDGGAPAFDMTRWVTEEKMTRGEYWLTQPNVVRTYLRLFFFPVRQNLDYDYPVTGSPDAATALSLALEIALAGAAVFFRKRFPVVSFGILWAFLAMSLESVVVQNDVIYEHRLYLPMAGWSMAFAAGAAELVRRRRPYLVAAGLLVCALGAAAWHRNRVWKSELTLWQDVVQKSPKKARGYYNLGIEYEKLSRTDEAVAALLKACEYDRAYAEKKGGRYYPDAVEDFLRLGNIYAKQSDAAKAAGYYEQALAIQLSLGRNPYRIYTNLANAQGAMGQVEKACESYRRAMQAAPREARIFSNAGSYYVSIGRTAEGIGFLEEALRIDPGFEEAKRSLDAARGGSTR